MVGGQKSFPHLNIRITYHYIKTEALSEEGLGSTIFYIVSVPDKN